MMGLIHLHKSEHDKALAEAEQAVLDRPSCDISYAAKGFILNYLGRTAEAVELANFATRLAPVHSPLFYQVVLAGALYDSGKFEEAIPVAEEALRKDKQYLDALVILAGAKVALNRMDEAAVIADRIRQAKPDFALEKYARAQANENPDTLEQLLATLRIAGLN